MFSVPVVPCWKGCTSRLCQLGEEAWKQEHGAGAVPAALLQLRMPAAPTSAALAGCES